MRNYLKIFSIVAIWLYCFILNFSFSYAQKASPGARLREATAGPILKEGQLEKIRKLKEKVATKVVELRKKSRQGYFGEISKVEGKTIFLTTKKGEVAVKVSEETKIFRVGISGRKKITLEDLKVGEKIFCFGILEEEVLNAKIIIAKKMPFIINGKVINVDLEKGTIKVKTLRKGEFVVDYETNTKCKMFEKGKGLTSCGLSKIKVDDRVHVIGEKLEENRLTASRILVLPGRALGIVGKEEATPTTTLVASPTP